LGDIEINTSVTRRITVKFEVGVTVERFVIILTVSNLWGGTNTFDVPYDEYPQSAGYFGANPPFGIAGVPLSVILVIWK